MEKVILDTKWKILIPCVFRREDRLKNAGFFFWLLNICGTIRKKCIQPWNHLWHHSRANVVLSGFFLLCHSRLAIFKHISTNIYFLAASFWSHLSCYFSNCPINGQCCELTEYWKREGRKRRGKHDDTTGRRAGHLPWVLLANRSKQESKQK